MPIEGYFILQHGKEDSREGDSFSSWKKKNKYFFGQWSLYCTFRSAESFHKNPSCAYRKSTPLERGTLFQARERKIYFLGGAQKFPLSTMGFTRIRKIILLRNPGILHHFFSVQIFTTLAHLLLTLQIV